jgi:hypothetical protein
MTNRRARGTGSVYEQDGHWMGAISVPSSTGRRRQYFKAATKEEAISRVEYFLRNDVRVDLRGVDKLTVSQYLKHWLRSDLPGTVSLRTEEIYANLVRLYIDPSIGQIRLHQLQPADVTRMLADMSRRNFSPSTRRMVRATLHRAFRVAQYNASSLGTSSHCRYSLGRPTMSSDR